MKNKFQLVCRKCKHVVESFTEWFAHDQKCPKCSHNIVDTVYFTDKSKILDLISKEANPENMFHYFDFLPLNDRKNIVTDGEGITPIERWDFLEDFAKRKYGLSLQVYINRSDKNFATGTFKDKGGALAASVLKEAGIKEYVVVSTGNTATAFAHYLAKAGISCSVFVPENALPDSEAHIATYGQKLFRVKGDYAHAKKVAADYARKYKIQITGGNLDPLRLEAKKTLFFEILRVIGRMPDVYIQALSGGTGPFAMEKALNDISGTGLADRLPRYLLTQGDRCAPQAHAWEKAKKDGFPKHWETVYPIYENPVTLIPTIATGNPALFPLMGPLVRKTDGEIFEFKEEMAVDIARLVAYERVVKIGPASAAGIAGFFESLKRGLINNEEMVLINIGESAGRALGFMQETAFTAQNISSSDDCERFVRESLRQKIWAPFE